jgi:Tol biopolymer transport system component/imidazolonepropionase-like amidohydrolase
VPPAAGCLGGDSVVGAALALLAVFPGSFAAQDTATKSWDVTQPRGRVREIDFITREGTWMSVDLSPDGRWIVFDLLGHIYRMPATGGTAIPLTQTSGIALNQQPRYSPDGTRIAFISDRGGQDNLWVMNADGSDPHPVVSRLDLRMVEPVWMPDGRFIVVRQALAQRLLLQGLHLYHVAGGQGVELIAPSMQLTGSPSITRDGRLLCFHRLQGDRRPMGHVDPLRGDWQLACLDLRTGETTPVTGGRSSQTSHGSSGGAFGPEISPDGRWLAFARRQPDHSLDWKGHRYGPRTDLWLRDVETGAERLLVNQIEPDMAGETTQVMTVVPRYRWSADGRTLVFSQNGGFRRLHLDTGKIDTIPFTARVHRIISERAYAPFRIPDGPFDVRYIRWPASSPDGRWLAFEAVGRIWLLDLRSGAMRRLTTAAFPGLEYTPAWSPDGRSIAFTTWDAAASGHVWRAQVPGGAARRLSTVPAEYFHPTWSPDGSTILVTRGSGATLRGWSMADNTYYDLVRMPAGGGRLEQIARVTVAPDPQRIVEARFGPDGRVFYLEPDSAAGRRLISMRLDGSDKRVHGQFPDALDVTVSPDGSWLALEGGGEVYLAPFPYSRTGGVVPRFERQGGVVSMRRLSTEGGLFPRWRNATTLEFVSGDRYFTHAVKQSRIDTIRIRLRLPRDIPSGAIALTGARLVTLEDRRVIERGTLVVRRGRIACVGECDLSGVDRVVDLTGHTIIPGWVDMHAHHHRKNVGVIPTHGYEAAAYLAYGVTTTLDPGAIASSVFPTAQLVEAGAVIGPRIYSTAEPLYPFTDESTTKLATYQDAAAEVARRQSWGATAIKEYLQRRRDQRQWVADIARRRGIMLTGESSLDLAHKLGMAMDGYTGYEHSSPQVPLYEDATQFLGRAGGVYSSTLVVAGPGPWGEEYFWQESDLWKNPKLARWTPWYELVPHTRQRMLRPETDYPFPLLAQGAADIIAAGGHAAIGSHGQQHGLASHWEVWMLARAMSPMQALEVASTHGAYFLGADRDLGSIAVGKLADLMVLRRNPLTDIHNTLSLEYVMKGGRLWRAETLDEVWPNQRPFGTYAWLTGRPPATATAGGAASDRHE